MCLLPTGAVFIIKKTFMKITEYIKETKAELKHMTWPTRSQALNATFLVIGISVLVSLILAVLDFVFGLGLEKLIQK